MTPSIRGRWTRRTLRCWPRTTSGRLATNDEIAFSGFFRTYNLALFSNFGEGLIRQSEFRTVEGAEARETHTFTPWLEGDGRSRLQRGRHSQRQSGPLSLQQSAVYGPFVKVLANNVTIRDADALCGPARRPRQACALLCRPAARQHRDEEHRQVQARLFLRQVEHDSGTQGHAGLDAGHGSAHWLPSASFSIGQAFFTEDPRIGVANSAATGRDRLPSSVRALPRRATGARKGVLRNRCARDGGPNNDDGDPGQDRSRQRLGGGPGTGHAQVSHRQRAPSVRELRHSASGLLQGRRTPGNRHNAPGTGAEAPRTIFDALATLDRLPLGLHARGEYEYVGHKFLDVGNPQHPDNTRPFQWAKPGWPWCVPS